jgi:hypothetical protein
VFIKKLQDGFIRDIEEAMTYVKTEFEMKHLGKNKFFLGL